MSNRAYDTCFVIGPARSGTTWLSAALNAHPDIYCTEHRLFGKHFDVVRDGPDSDARVRITLQSYCDSLATCCNIDGLGSGGRMKIESRLARTLFDMAHELTNAPVIVDKITPYVGTSHDVVRGITGIFPESIVIHINRDPRDVLVSGVMHWLGRWVDDQPGEFQRRRSAWIVDGDQSAAMSRFFTDAEITEWSRAWKEPLRSIDGLSRSLSVHAVSYEAMLRKHAASLTDVFRFLGVDAGSATVQACVDRSTFERMSGGRKQGDALAGAHVRSGVAGDWRRWMTRQDGELLWSLIGDDMTGEEYARDDSWVSTLPDVIDNAPSTSHTTASV